jgi:hypothetical protein
MYLQQKQQQQQQPEVIAAVTAYGGHPYAPIHMCLPGGHHDATRPLPLHRPSLPALSWQQLWGCSVGTAIVGIMAPLKPILNTC